MGLLLQAIARVFIPLTAKASRSFRWFEICRVHADRTVL